MADKSFDKRLAYAYLDELQKEFTSLYEGQIETVKRPYFFIRFDTFIQKTKKIYMDTRAGRNLQMLKDEIQETLSIAHKTVDEVLSRGKNLDGVCVVFVLLTWRLEINRLSTNLSADSERFRARTEHMNKMAMLQKWAPAIVMGLIALLLIWLLVRRWM